MEDSDSLEDEEVNKIIDEAPMPESSGNPEEKKSALHKSIKEYGQYSY